MPVASRGTGRKLGMLALVLFVIVPLAMAPKPRPEKIQVGPVKPNGLRPCIAPLCGGFVLEERDAADAVVRQVVHGPDGPLWQVLADGSSQYIHEDPRGNVAMLTEGTGTAGASPGDVLERVTYDVFGKPTFQDAANQDKTGRTGTFAAQSEFDNDLLFSGLLYDPETGSRGSSPNSDFGGFYSSGGRYYNADEGRYVTRSDPSGEEIHPDGYGRVKVRLATTAGNRYVLAGHAPVNTSVRKMPGRLKWENITLKRGAKSGHDLLAVNLQRGASGSSAAGHELGHALGSGSATGGRPATHTPEWTDFNAGDPGVAASSFSFGVEREMKESGEKGGTEDINIGIGEMQASGYGQTDLDLLHQRAGTAHAHGHLDFLKKVGDPATYRGRHRMFAIVDRSIPTSDDSPCWIRVSPPSAAKDAVVKGKNILEN